MRFNFTTEKTIDDPLERAQRLRQLREIFERKTAIVSQTVQAQDTTAVSDQATEAAQQGESTPIGAVVKNGGNL